MIDPRAVELYNKGTYALPKNNLTKAYNYLKQSVKIQETRDAYLNLGTACKALDLDDEAVKYFKKATDTKINELYTSPSIGSLGYNNLGLMEYVHGRDDKAIEYYQKGLQLWYDKGIKEVFGDCAWNLATAILRQVCNGKYDNWHLGWQLYENRFRKNVPVKIHDIFKHYNTWDGQRDCKILLAQEQGIGDNIMFVRFLPYIEKTYNVECVLQASPSKALNDIFRSLGVKIYDEIYIEDYDYMLPIGSVCKFASEIDRAPYIKYSGKKELGSSPNIGLVWSGSVSHGNNRHRSCPVGYFKFLEKYGTIWSLNPGATSVPKWIKRTDIKDWNDTCAYLNGIDLLISVDTSIVHMAGAMGIPTLMLQPRKETDFRWGTNRKDNLWYDSVTIIQNPNDWEKCMENLKAELEG